jgi:ATP-dependent DNA helicase DinG
VNKKLLSFFPKDYEPSTGQINVIKEVDAAFSNNKKFCIISAPTGTGKSFLATTLANASNHCTDQFKQLINSYAAFKQDGSGNYTNQVECEDEPPFGAFTLTITKNLQDQYKDLFKECTLFKGKANYICEVDGISEVDTAPCLLAPRLKEDCWSCNKCLYYNNRNIALTSRNTILNYKLFLHLPRHVKRKNYIICDEASELENEITRMFSLSIDIKKLHKLGFKNVTLPRSHSSRDMIDWLTNLSLEITLYIDQLIKQQNKNTNMVLGEKNKIVVLRTLFFQINTTITEWLNCEWVIDSPEKYIINITPLKINTLTKHIFDYGDQIVLMSATIIDHKKYASSLGITDYKYIEATSNFKPQQSPIYISSKNCLNFSNKDKVLPSIAKQIIELCDVYKNDKGIIHTHSMDISNFLKKYLKDKRFLFRDEIKNNSDILNKHYSSKEPTVVVSPSLTHGVDLKDDLGRFCIVVKLPFLPLGDKRIKKLSQIDSEWYQNQMLNILVQMCGRTTRSKNDYSATYILDGNAFKIIPKVKDKLPLHFLERIN